MMGFGGFESAQKFCRLFEEVKNFFRPRLLMGEFVSLSERRKIFLERVGILRQIFEGA
jgi:hypothetical protein